MDEDFKLGTLKRLGLPHSTQADVGKAGRPCWHECATGTI